MNASPIMPKNRADMVPGIWYCNEAKVIRVRSHRDPRRFKLRVKLTILLPHISITDKLLSRIPKP